MENTEVGMTQENERIDAVVHKYDDIPIKKFGEGIDLRRIAMTTVAQTWVEMKQGFFSPLHRHEDEQTVVLIKGKLRARSGPQGEEIYEEMNPGDVLTVPSNVVHQVEALVDSVFCEAFGPGPNLEKGIQTVFMRKQARAEAQAKANKD
ncbi:cupin domain-containing protein [Paraglaciecola sp.]|nr:cupin domain-containing protein [Paraglaciecola sp.]